MSAIRLDGGLATTLQRVGLAPFTPVNDWLITQPDAIRAAHGAFVDAGARIVLAGTFRALPHVDPRWPTLVDRAVTLCREAAGDRAAVWASLGPASTPEARFLDAPVAARRALAHGWVWVAGRAVRLGCAGIALETFVDAEEALAGVQALRAALPHTPLIASLVVDAEGRLFSGDAPRAWIERLMDAGATGAGFGCGDGPHGVEAAVARCGDTTAPLWAKPAAGDAPRDALIAALRRLDARCTWVGGCCGVDPSTIAALDSPEVRESA